MGLELDLASEQLALAADGVPGGGADEVPLLARVKEINGLSASADRALGYANCHPLAPMQDKVEEMVASGPREEDKAPLLVKGRLASDDADHRVVPSSSSNGGVSSGDQHQSESRNGTLAGAISLEEMEVKYAAYVRKDAYGTWGAGQLSLWEAAKLILAVLFLVPMRALLLLSILVAFYLICRICTLFRIPSQQDGLDDYGHLTGVRRSIIVNSGRFCARSMLFVLGFYRINVTERDAEIMQRLQLGLGDNDGEVEDSLIRPGAIVSNHISYLDILYHMSASFPSFVAKRSVTRIPLVGLISQCLGCLYVQRESKSSDFKGVSGVVVERLHAAHQNEKAPSLLLFPEGTTTNGDYLLPFKTGAFLARTPVMPVILKYPYERFSPAWDTITGVRHVCLLLCQFINYLEVTRLPVYVPTGKECSDPKLYAENVRRLMAAEGDLILSDVGLPEKRIYHSALRGNSLPKSWGAKHRKSD